MGSCMIVLRTYTKSFDRDIPDHKCTYASPAAIYNDIVINMYRFCPTCFVFVGIAVGIVLKCNCPRVESFDGNV